MCPPPFPLPSQIEDLSAQAQSAAADQFKMKPEPEVAASRIAAPVVEEEDEGDVDESGVETKDVELVMTQANVSRSKAVRALKNADGDIVSAIMVRIYVESVWCVVRWQPKPAMDLSVKGAKFCGCR